MSIQWFPGHMASARKKAAEAMSATDVVIEVVDARLPAASSNPLIHELRAHRQRACLKVLNKADLADPQVTRQWLDHFQRHDGLSAVAVSCRRTGDVARLPALCRQLAPHRDDNTKPLRMMIMGIPNVGKSTLMNALLKRKLAQVGDEPAVTKRQQTSTIDLRHSLTDTPGLLWPKIEHPDDGLMLAASHAVGRNAMDDDEVAIFLAGVLLARYPALLAGRYALPAAALSGGDAVAIIEGIAQRRGLRRRGGEVDFAKAATLLLQDYRDGALGRVTLETPATRRTMLEASRAAAAAGSEALAAESGTPDTGAAPLAETSAATVGPAPAAT
ncbi:MAG TPA: ribosome biogenesis GTPase YlqF [Accumulibacter sp.]|nr:ribosome biogenesis GTPase YlqF [Accumulibacter sp.]